MHVPILHTVKAWVSPDGGERWLRWLEERHMAEVLLVYGLESRDALAGYLASAARERFWRELEPLNASTPPSASGAR